jgi:hypothetical protein
MKDIDFKQYLKYDFETKRNCRENGGCIDGICRCSTIHNVRIFDADFKNIAETIYNNYFDESKSTKRNNMINSLLFDVDKQVDLYTIDRILRTYKIWETKPWAVEISNGYYGEEITKIILTEEISKEISNHLNNALTIDELNKKIEYLLTLEYGYLLPELENSRYQIIEINRKDVIFGSREHYKKLKKLSYYNDLNYNNIKGIVIKNGNKWRLIDGYHRIFSSTQKTIKVIQVV